MSAGVCTGGTWWQMTPCSGYAHSLHEEERCNTGSDGHQAGWGSNIGVKGPQKCCLVTATTHVQLQMLWLQQWGERASKASLNDCHHAHAATDAVAPTLD